MNLHDVLQDKRIQKLLSLGILRYSEKEQMVRITANNRSTYWLIWQDKLFNFNERAGSLGFTDYQMEDVIASIEGFFED